MGRPQIPRAMSGALRPLDRAEIFRCFASGVSGLEFRRELLGLAREDADVRPDRDEETAALEPAACVGFDARENSGRFAGLAYAADRVVDDRNDFRIVGLAGIAERGVANAINDALDPLGAAVDSLPMSHLAIWKAIGGARKKRPLKDAA